MSNRKSRANRWAYMGRPGFNPPNDRCPECTEPSKVHFMGGQTVDGVSRFRWNCEHGHEWIVYGDMYNDPPAPSDESDGEE